MAGITNLPSQVSCWNLVESNLGLDSASMSFEIALAGSFSPDDPQLLKDVQNRLTLNTDSNLILHREHYEFVLDLPPSHSTFYKRPDGSSLRAERDLTANSTTQIQEWTLHTYTGPIRQYDKALVRSCAVIPLASGDVLPFASSLGYRVKEVVTRKGWLFRIGATKTLSLYQIVPSASFPQGTSRPPTIWHVEVTDIVTTDPASQKPAKDYIDPAMKEMLSIAILMKGLVDLIPEQP